MYRVKKLDGATKRRVFKLRARVAPTGGTLSVRPKARYARRDPARQRHQRQLEARRRRRARARPRDRPRGRGRGRRRPGPRPASRSNDWCALMGSESGPASARPMTTAPREIAATSAAGPAPSSERAREQDEAAQELEGAVGGEGDGSGHDRYGSCPTAAPEVCETGTAATVHRSAVPRVRLDSLLAERGLFPSRTRAAAAVMAGQVRLGPGDARGGQAGPARRARRRARRRRAAALRLARRDQARATRSTRSASTRRGPPLPRRRRLHRRLHRLPAPGAAPST